jgi:DNA primase catalytic subunit
MLSGDGGAKIGPQSFSAQSMATCTNRKTFQKQWLKSRGFAQVFDIGIDQLPEHSLRKSKNQPANCGMVLRPDAGS